MEINFKNALNHVLVHEGGWSDHPRDPGGATMKGVTLITFRRHFGEDKSREDLRNISEGELEKIYGSGYWHKCHCNELPSGIDYAVFDAAVNSAVIRMRNSGHGKGKMDWNLMVLPAVIHTGRWA